MSYFYKISHVFSSSSLCSVCSFLSQKHHFLHEPPLLIQTSINWIIISVSRQKLRVRGALTCSHGFIPPHTIWNYPLLHPIHTHKNPKSHTGKRNKSAQPREMGKRWWWRKKCRPDSDKFLAKTARQTREGWRRDLPPVRNGPIVGCLYSQSVAAAHSEVHTRCHGDDPRARKKLQMVLSHVSLPDWPI